MYTYIWTYVNANYVNDSFVMATIVLPYQCGVQDAYDTERCGHGPQMNTGHWERSAREEQVLLRKHLTLVLCVPVGEITFEFSKLCPNRRQFVFSAVRQLGMFPKAVRGWAVATLFAVLATASKTPRCSQTLSSSSSMSTNVQGPKVFLTVSSLAATTLNGTTILRERLIEMNWLRGALRSDDWVGLFDHDPTNNPLYPLDKVLVGDIPQGFYRTAIQLPVVDTIEEPLERRCLGYWIGYVSAGKAEAIDCLKIEPRWMEESHDYISNLRLIDTLIPGTHDSGSYETYHGLNSEGPLTRWVMCQDENFWNQLVLGIRYFDMRVAYYSSSPQIFWLNHGVVRVNPLQEAIDHLKRFLNSTQEIVILDFHNFPVGFAKHPERHDELSAYLMKELGQYMLPRSAGYGVTLGDIWQSGRRLVVGYSHSSYVANPYFWSGIPQRWANTMNLTSLHDYLGSYMEEGSTALWAAMAEFTPSTAAVILLFRGSLRTFADSVNRNVTHWVRNEWWQRANIVATDYFRGNNLVDLAIMSNLRRATCRAEQARQEEAEAIARSKVSRYQPVPPYVGPRSNRRIGAAG